MELSNKKPRKAAGGIDLEIKGINIEGKPLFTEGSYSVYKGWIESDVNRDIPHYLIINNDTWVVEGSAARLFEARGMCSAFSKELIAQDKLLSKGESIVEIGSGSGGIAEAAKWDVN